MNRNSKRLPDKMELNHPASIEILEEAQAKLQVRFPTDYISSCLNLCGAEGQIGSNSYLAIWSAEEIIPCNVGYAVNEFTPGLVYFGSDGGGMAYAFGFRGATPSIVEFPFESIKIEDASYCGNTFNEFLEYLYNANMP